MENHIEIAKEYLPVGEYAFRQFTKAPKPPQRDHGSHGAMLKTAFEDTVSVIMRNRQELGMDPENLLVLQLSSGEAMPSVEILQSKLRLALVEEVKEEDGTMRFLVQFSDKDAIGIFENERALWESDSHEDTNVLTYAQRRDLFACIESIRPVSPEDRTGKRLSEAIVSDTLPDGLFVVDIDVWFNGNISERNIIEGRIKKALGTGGSTLLGDLFVLPNLLLGRAKVNRFTLEALRKLDLIAQVDYPIGVLSTEQCELYSTDFVPTIDNTLDREAPLACVIDSGIFSANPLLSNLIVAEEDFDLTENTTSDQNGHGTGVAGIVAYGSFENYDKENQVFKPLVRLCNGKVTHNTSSGASEFSENKRPEQIIDAAIRFFHEKYHCRVFNISLGDPDQIYKGGRQMSWGSMIDEVSNELDIVVVVSAGNVNQPAIPSPCGRDDLMGKTRNQLLEDAHRIIDPATTALGVTVGSITRYEEPETSKNRTIPLSAGKKNYPSVFTRTGEGVNGAIKPEFIDYGGNFALTQLIAGSSKWNANRALNEPTLNNDHNPVFKGWHGTSFAAPHVTHIVARLQRSLQAQLGEEPSANLIRALLASSAQCVEREWLEATVPIGFSGEKKRPQEWRLRLGGYGKVDDSTLFTDRNHVTLFTEESLDLRQMHIYKIPVPKEFLALHTTKRIAVGLAYNPPTRLSRKDYIANSLWFEIFRRTDIETLQKLQNYKVEKRKRTNQDSFVPDSFFENFSATHGAGFSPGATELSNSTLQQRVWEKKARGGSDLLWEDNAPFIYVLVTGKAKFKHPLESQAQSYALAITFSYDGEEDIQLRQKLAEQVKLKQREKQRIRAKISL